jgi:hypothetical protein
MVHLWLGLMMEVASILYLAGGDSGKTRSSLKQKKQECGKGAGLSVEQSSGKHSERHKFDSQSGARRHFPQDISGNKGLRAK